MTVINFHRETEYKLIRYIFKIFCEHSTNWKILVIFSIFLGHIFKIKNFQNFFEQKITNALNLLGQFSKFLGNL
jgi:hypothetical protein